MPHRMESAWAVISTTLATNLVLPDHFFHDLGAQGHIAYFCEVVFKCPSTLVVCCLYIAHDMILGHMSSTLTPCLSPFLGHMSTLILGN